MNNARLRIFLTLGILWDNYILYIKSQTDSTFKNFVNKLELILQGRIVRVGAKRICFLQSHLFSLALHKNYLFKLQMSSRRSDWDIKLRLKSYVRLLFEPLSPALLNLLQNLDYTKQETNLALF